MMGPGRVSPSDFLNPEEDLEAMDAQPDREEKDMRVGPRVTRTVNREVRKKANQPGSDTWRKESGWRRLLFQARWKTRK